MLLQPHWNWNLLGTHAMSAKLFEVSVHYLYFRGNACDCTYTRTNVGREKDLEDPLDPYFSASSSTSSPPNWVPNFASSTLMGRRCRTDPQGLVLGGAKCKGV